MTVVHQGRWTLEDRAASIYRYLPFDVPPGTPGVAIDLAYERGPGAILDLGLFDPSAARGWSGGERRHVVVTERAATPGYLPGPLPAGEWRVILGLYRIPAGGLPFELRIELGPAAPEPLPPAPPRPERPPRRDLPASPGRQWLAGDLHSHSVHSDGRLTVAALACLAAGRGLDFLAVTDHNTVSHYAELAAAGRHAGIELVPGQEVTTNEGHANAIGPIGWVDFRRTADEWLAAVGADGGLLSINHPVDWPYDWRRSMTGHAPLVEAWHSSWDRRLPEPLEWWASHGGVPVGGSDFHRVGNDGLPGQPTTWVEAVDADVLGALRAGRVALSAEPAGPLALPVGDEVVAIDAEGATLLPPDGPAVAIRSRRERHRSRPGLWRLIDGSRTTLALAFVVDRTAGASGSVG